MKRTKTLYAVTALVALAFASQVFAKGGSMCGGQVQGNTGGTRQMVSTIQPGSGSGMQQRRMLSNGSRQGTAGSGAKNMKQGSSANSVDHQNGQMNGTGTGRPAIQPPVITTIN